jgi:hypothetical protein
MTRCKIRSQSFLSINMLSRYAEKQEDEAERFVNSLLTVRTESFGLLKDLHDLWSMANEVKLGWIIYDSAQKHFVTKNYNRLVCNLASKPSGKSNG